jgi:hypothetical protein
MAPATGRRHPVGEEDGAMSDPIKIEIINPEKGFSEKLSTYAPIFISALALIISLLSANETYLKDKIAAEPSLSFGKSETGLYLNNFGNGPAIVKQYSLYVDGQEVLPFDDATWDRVVDTNSKIFFGCPQSKTLYYNQAIPAGQSWPFLIANPSDVDGREFRRLIRDRLVVRMKVCSLHGDCETICSTVNGKCDGAAKPPMHPVKWILGRCATIDGFL